MTRKEELIECFKKRGEWMAGQSCPCGCGSSHWMRLRLGDMPVSLGHKCATRFSEMRRDGIPVSRCIIGRHPSLNAWVLHP